MADWPAGVGFLGTCSMKSAWALGPRLGVLFLCLCVGVLGLRLVTFAGALSPCFSSCLDGYSVFNCSVVNGVCFGRRSTGICRLSLAMSPGGAECVFENAKTYVSARCAFLTRSLQKLRLGCLQAPFLSHFGNQVRFYIPFWSPRWPNQASFQEVRFRAKFTVKSDDWRGQC